jgi:hypothetical protein
MTINECENRIKDLQEVCRIYNVLYNDKNSSFYSCDSLKQLNLKANYEIIRLQELMYNLELEDSYDQNTGKLS